MREIIELAAATIEAVAVAIIAIAIVHGSVRFLVDFACKSAVAYERYKIQRGKGLLLGLEFLVAADVVRTVVLEPTVQNVMILGLLVSIRTFLSWSLVVEIEGKWPWQSRESVEGRVVEESERRGRIR